MSAIAALLPDGRLHLQHGPIDCLCRAWGEPGEVRAAYNQAASFFATVLDDLCAELPLLRSPLPTPPPTGRIAQAMHAACMPFADRFITPMAAVAGAVADAVLAAMVNGRALTRAYVNNGGDIAFHLTPGTSLRCGLITDLAASPVAGLPGLVVGGVHNPVMDDVHNRGEDDVHSRVMGDIHNHVMGDVHNPVVDDIHNHVMGDVHNPVVDDIHNHVMGDVHNYVMGDVHDPVVDDVHNPVVDDVHNYVMDEVHNRVMSDVHNRGVSDAHNREDDVQNCVMAGLGPATHDLRSSNKGKSWVTGPSPVMTHLPNPHLPNPHLPSPRLTSPRLTNPRLAPRYPDGTFLLTADHPARGLATSGRACKGHGGRSFSFGIADSVTILARTAAQADAAATIVGNAVDLPGHPAIDRRPASEIDPASDLGDRPITFDVGPLDSNAIDTALDAGETMADTLLRDGLIEGAILALRSRYRVRNPSLLEVA